MQRGAHDPHHVVPELAHEVALWRQLLLSLRHLHRVLHDRLLLELSEHQNQPEHAPHVHFSYILLLHQVALRVNEEQPALEGLWELLQIRLLDEAERLEELVQFRSLQGIVLEQAHEERPQLVHVLYTLHAQVGSGGVHLKQRLGGDDVLLHELALRDLVLVPPAVVRHQDVVVRLGDDGEVLLN